MSDRDRSKAVNPNYTSKSETERVFDVFNSFQRDAQEINSISTSKDTGESSPVLTMSSIGQLGRFGNQLFQYAYLRICAAQSGAKVECPPWIGQTLFGHQDSPISQRLPPAIEQKEEGQSLFDVIPEFITYLEKLANVRSDKPATPSDNGRASLRVGAGALSTGLSNVDLWGFFQCHTRYFKPHQQYFRSLFEPVDDLKSALESGLNILRSKGKTIVGIHIRRGDYITQPMIGFTLLYPTQWYCQWLKEIWDELEDPVLLLCSDDIDSIIGDFDKFNPIIAKDLKIELPERLEELDIDFYLDFYLLSHCDVLVTSNSNFSFVASMLNKRAKMFVRTDWDFSQKFQEFDPWNSKPLLWWEKEQAKFVKSLPDSLSIIYKTQGFWAMLKCLLIYFPQSQLKGLALRVYLGYQIQGTTSVIKSFLGILGLRK